MERIQIVKSQVDGISGRILDVGCELGTLHKELQSLGQDVYGIDIMASGGSNMVRGDAQCMPFRGSTFNGIVAGELIEYLDHPEEFLKECHRVLELGGRIIITTPNGKSWLNRLTSYLEPHDIRVRNPIGWLIEKKAFKKLVGYRITPPPEYPPNYYHKTLFDQASLVKMCQSLGFGINEVLYLYYEDCDSLVGRAVLFVKRIVHHLVPRRLREGLILVGTKEENFGAGSDFAVRVKMPLNVDGPRHKLRIGWREVLRAPLPNLYLLRLLQLVLDNLGLSPEDAVLDVGCGEGTSTLVLGKHAREVMGVDISRPIIQYLNDSYGSSPRVKFLCLDACDASVSLRGGQFDKAVCIDTLGYVSNPSGLINFMYCNLREGGRVVLTTKAISPLGMNEFSKADISSLFADCGFQAEIRLIRSRRFAQALNKFYDFFQSIGAKKPKEEEEFKGIGNRKFEDAAYPSFTLLQKGPKIKRGLIKVATYLLFWLCRSPYIEDGSARRFLVIAHKPSSAK